MTLDARTQMVVSDARRKLMRATHPLRTLIQSKAMMASADYMKAQGSGDMPTLNIDGNNAEGLISINI